MAPLEALPGAAEGTQDMPQQREVLSLLTWVASFVTHVANVAEKHPEKLKALFANMRLLIQEAQRHGGKVNYDYNFWFIATTDEITDWVQLDSSLLASFTTRQQSGVSAVTCTYCHEADHWSVP